MAPYGIMFHHFHDQRHPVSQGSIGEAQLEELLDRLAPTPILSARDWLQRSLTDGLADGDLCLTFDDNLRCQYDVALPVLRRRGLTAFWFVYSAVLQGRIERLEVYRSFRTNYFADIDAFYAAFFDAVAASSFGLAVEERLQEFDPACYLADFGFYTDTDRRFRFVRDEALGPEHFAVVMDELMVKAGVDVAAIARRLWMDDSCLRKLDAEGHVVGLHSHTHPTRLERLSGDAQWDEYSANFEHLRGLLGKPPLAMSHPCNSYNEDTLHVLRRLGIRLGFRANLARPRTCELDYPREDHANLLAEATV